MAVFLSVCGHASSEFFSVLSGIKGPELSVWRFLLGSFGLVILALIFPVSRNLLEPFREHGLQMIWLSILGISLGYLLFHWSLDYATISQVATMITTGPIFVGLINLWLNKQPFTAACLAVAILNQSLTAWQVLAIIVICTSVAVEATWARLRQLTPAGDIRKIRLNNKSQ